MKEAAAGKRSPAATRVWHLLTVLALLVGLIVGSPACSDNDLFVPGEIPIPPTTEPTATPTPDDGN